jgi:hypothetical protein
VEKIKLSTTIMEKTNLLAGTTIEVESPPIKIEVKSLATIKGKLRKGQKRDKEVDKVVD